MSEQPRAYRAPMRTPRTDDGSAAEWAIAAGVVGVDGTVRAAGEDLEETLAAVAHELDDRTAARIRRFAATPTGSYVWTRDAADRLHLGRLTGDWRHDPGEAAHRLGLPHQRPCDWAPRPIPDTLVPEPVLTAFARGGRNWQRIRAEGTGRASAEVWRRYA